MKKKNFYIMIAIILALGVLGPTGLAIAIVGRDVSIGLRILCGLVGLLLLAVPLYVLYRLIQSFWNSRCWRSLDPGRVIDWYRAQVAKPSAKAADWSGRGLVQYNLSIGYQWAGDFTGSIALLRQMEEELGDKLTDHIRLLACIGRCSAYLDLGDEREARREYDEARALQPRIQGLDPSVLAGLDARFRELDGELQEASRYWIRRAHTGRRGAERIFAHYNLARVYGALGMEKERTASLRYVAAKGRKLYVARQARQELELLR